MVVCEDNGGAGWEDGSCCAVKERDEGQRGKRVAEDAMMIKPAKHRKSARLPPSPSTRANSSTATWLHAKCTINPESRDESRVKLDSSRHAGGFSCSPNTSHF